MNGDEYKHLDDRLDVMSARLFDKIDSVAAAVTRVDERMVGHQKWHDEESSRSRSSRAERMALWGLLVTALLSIIGLAASAHGWTQ